jgi:DNA polymerase III sliding clamp (beta) subunit (PCNA family)
LIARLMIERDELRRILDSLHEMPHTSGTRTIDLNLVAKPPSTFELYISEMNMVQVHHEITDTDQVTVDVEQEYKFVFTAKVLRDIVGRANDGPLEIKFFEDKYAVRLSNEETFSTPTSLDLHLVGDSAFSEMKDVPKLTKVAEVSRSALIETLQTMEIVSNVVILKVVNDELWISVSDTVEGEGKVMKNTHPECDLSGVEYNFNLEPIIAFLDNIVHNEIDIAINEQGGLCLRGQSGGIVSTMHLAARNV